MEKGIEEVYILTIKSTDLATIKAIKSDIDDCFFSGNFEVEIEIKRTVTDIYT